MLQQLSLRDVGPTPALDLELAPRINLITGDNGLGKSFLLDIAWWTLTRTWAHYPAQPDRGPGKRPEISFRCESEAGKSLQESCSFDWEKQEWKRRRGAPAIPGMVLYMQVDGSFSVWDPARNSSRARAKASDNEADRPPSYRFSPTQIWDGLERHDPRGTALPEVLCNGLIRDWASWQKEKGRVFELLTRVLKRLAPLQETIGPGELTRLRLGDVRDMPTLRTPYAKDVPIVFASAALRRVAAMAYLLVWSWQEHVWASRLLNKKPAQTIHFLIDEIEAHLHPSWQRHILRALIEVVKELAEQEEVAVQILAVTHSPLVLASLEPIFNPQKDAVWLFELIGEADGRRVELRKDQWHRRGDAANWLRSDIFDLAEARSFEAEAAILAARALMGKQEPSRAEYEKIYEDLRRAMPGVDPFWVDWRAWAWQKGFLNGE